ncbi:carbon starvation protein CstA [Sulfuricaulis limicola]|uniref:Carbon starvation protein CstA n=1 Tax=Sulfuricaulis limicola TaxID=1620215 RepID=A0A1B4XDZ7_9GAMM|nr:carbon starvation CstA family protein [Sulfuricaulis limicola]BAV33034.1 carbon starvation protein CstA [Sulfuricaulis limicola]
MNSLFLLLAAAVAFVFGYRFYSRLLALGVFRLEDNYSIPAPERPAEDEPRRSKRHLIFGHHLASLAAGAAVMGSLVALTWGWIPAFLWVVVGTVTAAGTYGLGSLWLSLRYPGLNPAEIAARLVGAPAHTLFALFAFLVLLIMNAASATLAAQLLSGFPQAVLPFWAVAGLAWFLGVFLRGRKDFEILAAALIALILGLMSMWLPGELPLAFTGMLSFEAGNSFVAFDATVVWILILFAYGYHATRQPMWKLIRPRGYLTALLLGVMLCIAYTAVVINHPILVAPEFNAIPDIPATLPWLFVTLTSGAVAGFHLLIANGITARQIRRETDARYVGYGGALALGLLALSAVIIGSTGFADLQEWNRHYGTWRDSRDLHQVLALYINGYARLAGGIGLDPAFTRTLAATVMLGLLVATLEAGLRLQKQFLTGLTERMPSLLPVNEKSQITFVVLLSAALALHQARGLGGLAWWPLFGLADQLLAVLGFALLALALKQRGRPVAWVVTPLLFMAVVAHWAYAVLAAQWWSAENWLLLGLGTLLLVIELALAWLALNTLKSSVTPPA